MKKESLFTIAPKMRAKYILLFAGALMLLYLFTGCKKKNDTPPPNNNEMKATVVISPGNTININATGTKAMIGCAYLGGGTFVAGTSETNAAVYITAYTSNFSCVGSPGTYNFSCEYRKNVADPNTPIFSNNGINRGSITFTVANDHYMEGYFNAVSRCNSPGCVFGVDSVVIAGTFKGNY